MAEKEPAAKGAAGHGGMTRHPSKFLADWKRCACDQQCTSVLRAKWVCITWSGEVVDNSVDEAMAGFCDEINVVVHEDNSVTVTDNGRGIPVDMHATEKRPAAEVVLTVLHAGGKFDLDTYKVSGGLHGVGVSRGERAGRLAGVKIARDGAVWEQKYERGKPVNKLKQTGKTRKTGTKVTFHPDPDIFTQTVFSYDILAGRLRELAFLNKGLKITAYRRAQRQVHGVSIHRGHRGICEAPEQGQNGAARFADLHGRKKRTGRYGNRRPI